MNNRLFKIINLLDLRSIVIICLIIVILLLRFCSPKSPVKEGEVIKNKGKKYLVLDRTRDTQIITKTQTIYRPGEEIFVEKPIYVDLPTHIEIDTLELMKEYYAEKVYKDKIKLKDSLGDIEIIDTITQNKIKGRMVKTNINKVYIKDSIIVERLPRNQAFVGGTIGVDNSVGLNYFGPTFLLKTKSDHVYSVGVGINNNKSTSIQAGAYWKIKLKK